MSRRLLAVAIAEGAIILLLLAILISVWPGDSTEVVAGSEGSISTNEPVSQGKLTGDAKQTGKDEEQVPAKEPERVQAKPRQDTGSLGTVLYGQVIDRDGRPIKEASVYARRLIDRRAISYRVEGRGYAVAGLVPGTWQIRCRADNCKQFQEDVEIQGDGPQRFDIVMERAYRIRVAILTPEGKPFRKFLRLELACVATEKEPIGHFPMTTSRWVSRLGVGRWSSVMFGRAKLPERYVGEIKLDRPPPVWVSVVNRHHVVARKLVSAGQHEVVFELSVSDLRATFGSVRLMVLDSMSGHPVSDCWVDFSDRQTMNRGVKPDAEGRLFAKKVAPGLMELTIRAKGYEHYHQLVRVPAGAELDLGVVRLDPEQVISGSVLGPDGKPASSASLSWFRLDRRLFPQPLPNRMSTASKADGQFTIKTGRGRYCVRASIRGVGSCAEVVDTSAGPATGVRLQLVKGTPVQLVNRIPKNNFYLVRVIAPQGYPVYSRFLSPGSGYPIEIPPGSYKVDIHEDTTLIRSFDLSVGNSPTQIVVPH